MFFFFKPCFVQLLYSYNINIPGKGVVLVEMWIQR